MVITIDPDTKLIGFHIWSDTKDETFTVKVKDYKDNFSYALVHTIGNILVGLTPYLSVIGREKPAIECVACIEDYAFSRNGKGARRLAEFVGITKASLEELSIPCIPVNIGTWKKHILYNQLGLPKNKKTKAYKEQVEELFNRKFENHNEVDAFLISRGVHRIITGKVISEGGFKLRDRLQLYKNCWANLC